MEKFNLDFVNRTLTLTANFAAKMADPESDEYKLVMRYQNDIPNLKIVKKTHATPKSYTTKSGEKYKNNQFKNLTYERMERFIAAMPNGEAYMKEYETVKNFAEAAKKNAYPLVRDWFLAQFPNFRKDPLCYLQNPTEPVCGLSFLNNEGNPSNIEELKDVS